MISRLEIIHLINVYNNSHQHGKIISREELEKILAKEKTEELEVRTQRLHIFLSFE